ncbi:predicted protein [Streptomyces sp. SPB78]|uniref:hypothetical protein n=1 Tax=Streptomyces sp. (strain SPB78) TaxID=591157 RepID=UPI0001B54F65|nr:hypothetical protein [Streptomyces sp. SPB78]EFL04322.1 predicted protein [Streptomyces sp. SPB78]
MSHSVEPYRPAPLPEPVIPPGALVGYTPQGQPVYLPPQAQAPQPVYVQVPTSPIPAWLRNALVAGVGLLVVCTPLVVVLVVAAPAMAAMGQGIAYGGLGIGAGVIGIAAAIKSLRETPKPSKKK